jgi:hypothetical protein
MTADPGIPKTQTSSIQWRTTTFGDDRTTYNEIEKDPYLRERIETRNGFKTSIEGYKCTVEIYDNGGVFVFRKKVQEGYPPNTEIHNRTDSTEGEITRNFQGHKVRNLTELDQRKIMIIENMRILEFKMFAIEEFHPEEGWEIFYQHPIVVIENKAILILTRREPSI